MGLPRSGEVYLPVTIERTVGAEGSPMLNVGCGAGWPTTRAMLVQGKWLDSQWARDRVRVELARALW